jgi:RHS repeat-associated protein
MIEWIARLRVWLVRRPFPRSVDPHCADGERCCIVFSRLEVRMLTLIARFLSRSSAKPVVLACSALGAAFFAPTVAATQGEKQFCVVGGSCHPTLEEAEAELRQEPTPPVGRALLQPRFNFTPSAAPQGFVQSPTWIEHNYWVPDRVSQPLGEQSWHSFVGCTTTGVSPLYGSGFCASDTALINLVLSLYQPPRYCSGDTSYVLTVGDIVPFGGTTAPLGSYAGIPSSRLYSVFTATDIFLGTPVSYGTLQYRDGCSSPMSPPSVSSLHRKEAFVCDELFKAKINAPPSMHPFLCENLQTGTILEKPLQYCTATTDNPCSPATGQKTRHEVDFTADGMRFERHYHSIAQFASASGLGGGWTHNYDSRVAGTTPPWVSQADSSVFVIDERGAFDQFKYAGTISGVVVYRSVNRRTQLLRKRGSPLRWELQLDEGRTNFYDATTGAAISGKLLRMVDRSNPAGDITLTHDAHGRLTSVQNARGRAIRFVYDGWALTQVIAPDGQTYGYSSGASGLTDVAYPGGGVRNFSYDDVDFPKHLTGIHDENGDHYAEFAYDAIGRVTSSHLKTGDVAAPTAEGVTLDYLNGSTEVTTALGEVVTYNFAAGFFEQLTGRSDSAGADSTSYRADGRVDYSIDKKGVRTAFDYSATHPTVRIEAQNSDTQPLNAVSDERKVETTWDNALDVVTEQRTYRCDAPNNTAQPCNTAASVRWALEAVQRYAYNARGQVTATCQVDPSNGTAMSYTCGSSVNAPTGVRQTVTMYCDAVDLTAPDTIGSMGENLGKGCPIVGLVRRVDGPRTDVDDWTTSEYRTADDGACVSSPTTCAYRKGDLWKQINALGHITEYVSYDGAGRVKRLKDANAVLTDLTYHARGWLQTRTVRHDPAGTPDGTYDAVTTMTHDDVGQVTRITQPGGAYIDYTYDHAHRLTAIEDNLGNSIEYTLDAAGNRITADTKDASPTLTRTLGRVYDSLGRLQKIVDAYSEETVFTYDANGNQDTVTDPLSRVTDSDVDPLNRLIESTDALLGDTRYRYDARDNLVEVTDAEGLSTSYTFDGLGDQTQLVSPDTGTTAYTYDDAGNRVTQTDARSITSTYSYDELNRLAGIAYPTSSNDVAFTYDQNHVGCAGDEQFGVGRMTGYTDPSGSTELCYDKRGNLKRRISVVNAVTLTTLWSYDLADRVSGMTYPSGTTVTYGRDSVGRITSIGATPAGGSPTTLISAVTYYPYGPVKQVTWGNASTSLRTYDQNYGIDSINSSQATGLDLDFTLDEVGNIVAISDSIGGSPPDNSYTYDDLNRLTDVDGPGPVNVEQYSYDAIGNRLTKTVGAGSPASYVYGPGSHRLLGINGISNRSYDANGNTTSQDTGGNVDYVYDERNRLAARQVSSTDTHTYHYNARGERVLKVDVSTSANSRILVYDEAGRIVAKADDTGTALQEILWLDGLPVGLIVGPTLHYLQPDHLGTPRKVIDATGDLAIWNWPIVDNPFGEAVPDEDADGDTKLLSFNLRFPGQYHDAESGFHYNYFRDYESSAGRYAQSDPIGLSGGINTYAYVLGNPVSKYDPHGLAVQGLGLGAVAAMTACLRIAACRKAVKEALEACKDVRCKVTRHKAHHQFPKAGYCEHMQIVCYVKGGPQLFRAQFKLPGRCSDEPSPGDWLPDRGRDIPHDEMPFGE